MDVALRTSFTSTQDGDDRSVSLPGLFTPGLGSIARRLRETKSEYHMYNSWDRNTISPTHKRAHIIHTHVHALLSEESLDTVSLYEPSHFHVQVSKSETSRFFGVVK